MEEALLHIQYHLLSFDYPVDSSPRYQLVDSLQSLAATNNSIKDRVDRCSTRSQAREAIQREDHSTCSLVVLRHFHYFTTVHSHHGQRICNKHGQRPTDALLHLRQSQYDLSCPGNEQLLAESHVRHHEVRVS